jgi:hypothetical protein
MSVQLLMKKHASVLNMGSRFVNIRKLVALDILLHGRPFILVEFSLGTALPLALGVQQILDGLSGFFLSLVVGFYLALTGVDYLLLLVYAVIISRKDSAEDEAESELQNKSKYNRQQFILLVPLLVLFIGLKQEFDRQRETNSGTRKV